MRTTRTNDTALVAAAQAGDRRALEEVTATYLPLVYTIVRRGVGDHPDVDDVVQDVMLRALRQLPKLREPATIRSWLAAIAVRQVSTHLRRRDLKAARSAVLDEATEIPDARSPTDDLTLLRVDLSRQRRQVQRASLWLDPDDRALLPLWWMQAADQLTRSELADALGLSAAHAGVRVQRMRNQLEVSRKVVAALDARPRCTRLTAVVARWDGVPSPLWRKRVTRHVRSCDHCLGAAGALVATDRLLPAFALLLVPAGLSAGVFGKIALYGVGAPAAVLGTAGAGAKAGLLGQVLQVAAVHPVVSTVTVGTLVLGAAVTTTRLAVPPDPIAAPRLTPGAAAGTVPLGPASLESQNAAGRYVSSAAGLGVLAAVDPGADRVTRDRATFDVVSGLNDRDCVSFRYSDGRYLRHSSWRIRLSPDEGTPLFRGDATFCARTGAAAGSVLLESSNYPGWFLRHRGEQLWVDRSDGTGGFRADGSFLVRPPLSR